MGGVVEVPSREEGGPGRKTIGEFDLFHGTPILHQNTNEISIRQTDSRRMNTTDTNKTKTSFYLKRHNLVFKSRAS